jgi:dTDP-4-dehydrorhamnose reductase
MRLLFLGGSGQVGTEFSALARAQRIDVASPGRGEVDLMDEAALVRVVADAPWDCIINAAAYTNVDQAESEPDDAFAVNAKAPARLASETGKRGIPLIHISTDYVFDGRKGSPYRESDEVAPLNVYGASKRKGEVGVCAANPRHVVLRTSWVYSPFGKNFVKTILRLATERDSVSVVADQRGTPTAARDVARACLDIAQRCVAAPKGTRYGIYHFAGSGEASRFEFAQAIVEFAARHTGSAPEVVMSRTGDYPTAAVRPADTRLECSMIEREFGIKLNSWRDALRDTIDRLMEDKVSP